jgi:chromosomal replication initiation ATPase DnaA
MDQSARYPDPGKQALTLWQSALSELELQMTKATFDTWLRPTTLLTWEPGEGNASDNGSTRVVLGVPNGYVKDWLENRLYNPIARTLSGIAGQEVAVKFRITDPTDLQSVAAGEVLLQVKVLTHGVDGL